MFRLSLKMKCLFEQTSYLSVQLIKLYSRRTVAVAVTSGTKFSGEDTMHVTCPFISSLVTAGIRYVAGRTAIEFVYSC